MERIIMIEIHVKKSTYNIVYNLNSSNCCFKFVNENHTKTCFIVSYILIRNCLKISRAYYHWIFKGETPHKKLFKSNLHAVNTDK